MASLETRFALKMQQSLKTELNEAYKKLANGSQVIRDDAAATGMNCARFVGLIEGLETAAMLVRKVEAEMFDRKLEDDE